MLMCDGLHRLRAVHQVETSTRIHGVFAITVTYLRATSQKEVEHDLVASIFGEIRKRGIHVDARQHAAVSGSVQQCGRLVGRTPQWRHVREWEE